MRIVAAVCVAVGLVGCGSPSGQEEPHTGVTCTNAGAPAKVDTLTIGTGQTHTWVNVGDGAHSGTSTEVIVAATGNKLHPVTHTLDAGAFVRSAIAYGLNPIDAALTNGKELIGSNPTAAEISKATDPATYGWVNCHQ